MAEGTKPANVSSFNNRNGNVLPQAGDYTADMVGALAKPATNDGKRRVVVGDKLVEEAIKQDEILDTATNITYVLKIEAGVPYLDPTNSEDVLINIATFGWLLFTIQIKCAIIRL
ncbi:hypothetical protein Ah1_00029 [Aeromonas phage Ah1]|uniref:Uncharacterized protein n=1 Tax=Aeromonas phage Ah1 TaxID=2053701 RepID=A0A2H4YEH6_9CAUD|nr:hypothetical protein KNT77_gp029 [Aeromonas phage Ah1]AUE22570.1 hypothetical protein Ah1_00029 [Aeromonas phage Ah1]